MKDIEMQNELLDKLDHAFWDMSDVLADNLPDAWDDPDTEDFCSECSQRYEDAKAEFSSAIKKMRAEANGPFWLTVITKKDDGKLWVIDPYEPCPSLETAKKLADWYVENIEPGCRVIAELVTVFFSDGSKNTVWARDCR